MDNYLMHGLTTKRLRFRLVTPSDFAPWLAFYNDPESTRFWAGIPENPEEACTLQFNRIFERYEKGLGGMNALTDISSGAFIGLAGLLVQEVDGCKELEIAYSILPAHRRKGFAFEAAEACKNHAESQELANSLISIIHRDNLPSRKVALKNGMQKGKATIYKDNPVYIYRLQLR